MSTDKVKDKKNKSKKKKNKKTEVKEIPRYIYEILETTEIVNNMISDIISSLQKTTIIVDRKADNKMQCMMRAVKAEVEIFGKTIVEIEEFMGLKYICVKDVLIPYQTVSRGRFDSRLMGKWLNELMYDKDGNKHTAKDEDFKTLKGGLLVAPIKEVNKITEKMLGHFHSHDSVGGVGYSSDDTKDIYANLHDKKFWIEIIGTRKGYAGRIAITEPINVLIEVPVMVKWWENMEPIIRELENKIQIRKYNNDYKQPKNNKTHDIVEQDQAMLEKIQFMYGTGQYPYEYEYGFDM